MIEERRQWAGGKDAVNCPGKTRKQIKEENPVKGRAMPHITVKPAWLNKKLSLDSCRRLKVLLRDFHLHTVCESASCPNISECFSKGTATFLILGDVCTRNCSFCGITKGRPGEADEEEPLRIAQAAKRLNLNYVVVTSVTRDDLPDGGSGFFARTILEVKKVLPSSRIEVLIPDFKGEVLSLKKIINVGPDVIGHNLETVPSLYNKVRPMADYGVSLEVLRQIKKRAPQIYTKSGIMLGLGEEEKEVVKVLEDLRKAGCDFLSIGQYLQPSGRNIPVQEYVHPEKFKFYRRQAEEMGFLHVESSPYTRSSYCAQDYLKGKS